ncbi:hypothetical protein EAY27_02850 [Vibrio anguillarum]|uniref:hypothetical protein n=6 Tax=Vibrio TaxID=662 RepID=UPI00188B8D47|nr:hypothetical protein [Vibrio anguillarum]MBF4258640.1 hypothetical protein [Vibrio anguillarum]MBF4276153.1 hypothetical protein [Vibrio anguillarum]MBF4300804.1 hypothetical protein [Vibrio anguillarum]MBF4364427.1 hypothetical protein [Vibrio anguillarum]MBF4398986.1 hypothetical protein [Vibrio anguillarum]
MRDFTKVFERLIWFLAALIVFSGGVAIYQYRKVFDGTLSTSSNDWGALGSFIGGVFSPVIAFATLIAVVVTIRLQRTMLETQKEEFQRLYKLQGKSLDLTEKEARFFKDKAFSDELNAQKKLFLDLIFQQISIKLDEKNKAHERLYELSKWSIEGTEVDINLLSETAEMVTIRDMQIDILTRISVRFARGFYKKPQEMDRVIDRIFETIEDPEKLNELHNLGADSFDMNGA